MATVAREAICLDCDEVNELPHQEDWRFRPQCIKCCSRSLVLLSTWGLRPVHAMTGAR